MTKVKSKKPDKAAAGIPTFEPKAWTWMTRLGSIRGATAAAEYLDPELAVRLSQEYLKRSITLEESQCLVRPDGPLVTCPATGIKFQPVKYVTELPDNLDALLDHWYLTEIELTYSGCFFIEKGLQIKGYSGGLWRFDTEKQQYVMNTASPLCEKTTGGVESPVNTLWGTTSEKALEYIGKQSRPPGKVRRFFTNLMAPFKKDEVTAERDMTESSFVPALGSKAPSKSDEPVDLLKI